MRLVTYEELGDGESRVGMLDAETIYPVEHAGSCSSDRPSMLDIIKAGGLSAISSAARSRSIPLQDVRLRAPIPLPQGNVICLGRNYAEHAAEQALARDEAVGHPTFFSKAITSVTGPFDDIPVDDRLSSEIDWEVELGFIVGRRARNVSEQDALAHVFGYTVVNDVSARDLQYGYGGQFFYGKSLDGCCPMGPCVLTADEVPDPQQLYLRLRVNGEVKQEASTHDMIFAVRAIIATLSRAMTLLPGQIVATGTPAGVGYARKPPEYLKPGDLVEAEIDGIGTIRNRVIAI